MVTAAKMDDRFVWLRGASPRLMQSLPSAFPHQALPWGPRG